MHPEYGSKMYIQTMHPECASQICILNMLPTHASQPCILTMHTANVHPQQDEDFEVSHGHLYKFYHAIPPEKEKRVKPLQKVFGLPCHEGVPLHYFTIDTFIP